MTDADKEEVAILLGWNRGQMIDACEEGIFVNPAKLKPDMAQSLPKPSTQNIPRPPSVGRTETIVQPQLPAQLPDLRAPQPYTQPSGKFSEYLVHAQAQRPIVQPRPASAQPSQLQDLPASQLYTWPSSIKIPEHAAHSQAQRPRYSLGLSQMTQSRHLSGQSSRVPPPRQSRPYSSEGEGDISDEDDDREEEGDTSDEEESGEDDEEEEEDIDGYDEEVDSDNPIKEDDNSTSGTPFSHTEPFFGEWERNLERAQRVPELTAVHNASNIQQAGELLGTREALQHNFRSGQLRDSRASSNPKTKDGRGGRVPKDIFKHLESFVRKRNVADDEGEFGPSHPDGRPTPKESPVTLKTISQLDPVIGETSRLPPPATHRNYTPAPSGSHPMHIKLHPVIGETSHRPPLTMHRSGTPVPIRSHPMHASWYDIDEKAIAAEDKTELKPWDSVPHEYERTELFHNDINSVRSSAFMLAEEGGDQYRQDDEEMSYDEDESDWDSVISSESSITMTETSAHFTRSDQPRPTDIGQSAPMMVNAGGTNPDQPSVQRSAWRTTQSIPKWMMPADIRSKSSTTSTTAAGQQDPWNSSQYTPAGAQNGGFNRPGAQRPARMMQGLPKFRMFWESPGFNNGDSDRRG
ncbi:uncharacterized protein LACBIDRAFT_332700 [Laccaria bicolor S238N-H82]|uniref:Predicted protein n=1 Tax=Laccaria bicolor (strain S238N-H82 / ATCC MYA-4686) TaxID=486041 RepID=B0DTL1_LACBS|nr:uncharacterized protein LACBIDRAFT_332700 [Laccaria bicolor S238N-H82]EDR02135.1 predicted protein [Laccaria bicolor S238N-H82]|eukprot:XP_001887292.1 predicted protein [Laccaria bicolor S238N-H82]